MSKMKSALLQLSALSVLPGLTPSAWASRSCMSAPSCFGMVEDAPAGSPVEPEPGLCREHSVMRMLDRRSAGRAALKSLLIWSGPQLDSSLSLSALVGHCRFHTLVKSSLVDGTGDV